MHQGPAGHLPPKGPQLCPRMQTPGGGVWAGTPPAEKHPRGQRCTSTAAGTADRWPEGHGPREPRPTFPALIDAAQPDTWKDCRQREPGRAGSAGTPRRNPAQLAGHQDRHPVPPQRRTGPAPHPFRLQPLKDCRPTPPGGWIYPQPLRPDPMQPARQLPPGPPGGIVPHPGTRCSRKASRPTRPRPPATSQQPGPAGHLNTGSPAPAELGKWTHKRLRARARTRTRARSAGTDGASAATSTGEGPPPTRASPPSWTPQRPGRSGRNSVGRRQPAPPLDTGSRAPCRTPQRRQLAGHEKSTKPAEMVRNLVRKNANLLKISVFCGGERTRIQTVFSPTGL